MVFFAIVAIGCLTDLATKSWIFARLGMPGTRPQWVIWRGVFSLTTSLNEGALFGLGQGWTLGFAALSVVAAVAIVLWLFWARAAHDWALTIALAPDYGGHFWQPLRPPRFAGPDLELGNGAGSRRPAGVCRARLAAVHGSDHSSGLAGVQHCRQHVGGRRRACCSLHLWRDKEQRRAGVAAGGRAARRPAAINSATWRRIFSIASATCVAERAGSAPPAVRSESASAAPIA